MQQSLPNRDHARPIPHSAGPAALKPLDRVSELVKSAASDESSSLPSAEKSASRLGDDKAEPDDDVQRYMADLLARSRGGAPAPSLVAVQAPAAPVVRRTKPGSPPSTPKEARRQKTAPELASDLQRMRELANLNARQAIQAHSSKQLGSAMERWVLIAALCSGFSVALAFLSPPRLGLSCVASVGFFLAAIYSAVRYVCLVQSVEPVTSEKGMDRWLTTTALRIASLVRLGRK